MKKRIGGFYTHNAFCSTEFPNHSELCLNHRFSLTILSHAVKEVLDTAVSVVAAAVTAITRNGLCTGLGLTAVALACCIGLLRSVIQCNFYGLLLISLVVGISLKCNLNGFSGFIIL